MSERAIALRNGKEEGKYRLTPHYSIPTDALATTAVDPDADTDQITERKRGRSKFEREDDYQRRRYERQLSPERNPDLTDEELMKMREMEAKNEEELKEPQEEPQERAEIDVEDEVDGDKTPPRSSAKRKLEENGVKSEMVKRTRWSKENEKNGEEETSIVTMADTGVYAIPDEASTSVEAFKDVSEVPGVRDLQFFKEEDMKYFGKLFEIKDESGLSAEESTEIKVMKLLLRIKNGSPIARKAALKAITEGAREFGPKAIFNQILPLLLEKSLDDQERHLLVKVIDRILFKLNDMIRPYTHKILVVISPLLIDEDYVTRQEGREIISNLSKAAGLSHMISTMRPDIDHSDEFVRNTTSRALAVVASSLGVQTIIPFLKAVCHSKKSWQARHTGVKVIQQIAILSGCGVLPHLNGLIDCISKGLNDEQLSVRIMTANALAALAEASFPYGIESFEPILEPLWGGIRKHRGKGLAAFLKCIGYIIPLMDAEYASYYTKEVMRILLREFSSPDEEMKKTVLRVLQQCATTDGTEPKYLRQEVLPAFFKNFWVRRMALDRRTSKAVAETSITLAEKVGVSDIVEPLLNILKDESEPFRRMAVGTINRVVKGLGCIGLSERTTERLMDGLLIAYQEQTVMDGTFLHGLASVMISLDMKAKPFLGSVVSIILDRLRFKAAEVREQTSNLIALIAPVLKSCGETDFLTKLSLVLYESLGEVFPEVLGSILGALKSIINVVGIDEMQPPVNQLLPTLTPILRNRHEKVQENAIDLVGAIADKGPEFVSPKEWMRICFELLDMLKSTRKSVRKSANRTFGYIAKAVGPQEVLVTLLNNLKVQERQLRVCTAVAIGIVAETCAPFTVLPALMNEYRTPDVNVQNGVLKAMTFMFEYIGDLSADYMFSITPLIEDALTDRDLVHRQTAATVVRHVSLGCVGLGCEDVFVHFLNLLMPNVFETSPHVINRILESIEGIRNAIGPGLLLNYIWAGLFHPARKVRTTYWRIYNSTYVQQVDSIVPYYPKVGQPGYNLDIFDSVL